MVISGIMPYPSQRPNFSYINLFFLSDRPTICSIRHCCCFYHVTYIVLQFVSCVAQLSVVSMSPSFTQLLMSLYEDGSHTFECCYCTKFIIPEVFLSTVAVNIVKALLWDINTDRLQEYPVRSSRYACSTVNTSFGDPLQLLNVLIGSICPLSADLYLFYF